MEICINGISIDTIIGCHKHERVSPQELILNLKLVIDNSDQIHDTDDLKTTVDYDEVIYFIKNVVINTSYQLLEKLAIEINNKILEHYKIVANSTVEIIKPAICGVLAREIKVVHTIQRKYNVAIALGSNADNLPKQQIISAIEISSQYISDIKISRLYKTKPYGYTSQNEFYNAVIIGETTLKPNNLLAKIKKLEKMLGKVEEQINGPRIIDIDIVFFEDWVYTEHFLVIPHSQMHLRDFVLKPLVELAPSWVHPGLNKNVKTLLDELPQSILTIIGVEDYVTTSN